MSARTPPPIRRPAEDPGLCSLQECEGEEGGGEEERCQKAAAEEFISYSNAADDEGVKHCWRRGAEMNADDRHVGIRPRERVPGRMKCLFLASYFQLGVNPNFCPITLQF